MRACPVCDTMHPQVGDGDVFWAEHGRKQFPKVAEEVENLVAAYKQVGPPLSTQLLFIVYFVSWWQAMCATTCVLPQTAESFNRQAGADLVDPDEADQAATRNLMAAVSSLPELTEKKRVMDKHTELATALLGERPC